MGNDHLWAPFDRLRSDNSTLLRGNSQRPAAIAASSKHSFQGLGSVSQILYFVAEYQNVLLFSSFFANFKERIFGSQQQFWAPCRKESSRNPFIGNRAAIKEKEMSCFHLFNVAVISIL